MSVLHNIRAGGLAPWLCATMVPLFAFSCSSPDAKEPPWAGCRAASKTEYESAKRDFLLQNKCRRVCNEWPLVAALLSVLSLIVAARHSALGEPLARREPDRRAGCASRSIGGARCARLTLSASGASAGAAASACAWSRSRLARKPSIVLICSKKKARRPRKS